MFVAHFLIYLLAVILLYHFTLQIPPECQDDTNDLNNFLGIIEATRGIQQWVDTRQYDDICSNPTPEKTACVMDYSVLDHSLKQACADIGAMYVTSTYTFKCTTTGSDYQVFFTAELVPACLAVSCGIDGARGTQEQSADDVQVALESGGQSCQRMRFVLDDPIIPESKPKNCPDDTTFIMEEGIMANITVNVADEEIACIDSKNTCTVDFNKLYDPTTSFFNSTSNTTETIDQSVFEYTCASLAGGLYLEADYTLDCSRETGLIIGGQIFVRSFDTSLDSIQLSGKHDPLCVSRTFCTTLDFEFLLTRHIQNREWGDGWNCTLVSLLLNDFEPSESPTISAAPSVSLAPSGAPTISPAPTASMAPSSSPTDMTCLDQSIVLNRTDAVKSEFAKIQTIVDQIPFGSYCKYPADTQANPYVVTCDIKYPQIIPNHNMSAVCDSVDGMYVEDTATLVCTNGPTETRITQHEKPSCRAPKCNGLQVKDIVELELEWMEKSMKDQTCQFESIKVAIGGKDGQGSAELTEECVQESNEISTLISVYNQIQTTRNAFLDYVKQDLRSICASTSVGTLDCNFDWIALFLSGSDNPLQTTCQTSDGQYIESSFQVVCMRPDQTKVTMTNYNVPGCIGKFCSPLQALELLKTNHIWVEEYYEIKEWNCTTEVVDVFAPNYDSNLNYQVTLPPTPAPTKAIDSGDGVFTASQDYGIETNGSVPQFGSLWGTLPPTVSPAPTMATIDEDDDYWTDDDDDWTDNANGSNKKDNLGLIIGIVVGIIMLLCCSFMAYVWYKRRQEQYEEKYDDEENPTHNKHFDDEPRHQQENGNEEAWDGDNDGDYEGHEYYQDDRRHRGYPTSQNYEQGDYNEENYDDEDDYDDEEEEEEDEDEDDSASDEYDEDDSDSDEYE